jgi:hypothetical protein
MIFVLALAERRIQKIEKQSMLKTVSINDGVGFKLE